MKGCIRSCLFIFLICFSSLIYSMQNANYITMGFASASTIHFNSKDNSYILTLKHVYPWIIYFDGDKSSAKGFEHLGTLYTQKNEGKEYTADLLAIDKENKKIKIPLIIKDYSYNNATQTATYIVKVEGTPFQEKKDIQFKQSLLAQKGTEICSSCVDWP